MGEDVLITEEITEDQIAERNIRNLLHEMGYDGSAIQNQINPITLEIWKAGYKAGFFEASRNGYPAIQGNYE